MLDLAEQPSTKGLLERMTEELILKAALFLHQDGRILSFAGSLNYADYPLLATLVAAIASAGESLRSLGTTDESLNRIYLESDANSLYLTRVGTQSFLVTYGSSPVNPGLHRMQVRRYAETLAKLEAGSPKTDVVLAQIPLESLAKPSPSTTALTNFGTSLRNSRDAGATLRPVSISTERLFENITDDEIESLFDESST